MLENTIKKGLQLIFIWAPKTVRVFRARSGWFYFESQFRLQHLYVQVPSTNDYFALLFKQYLSIGALSFQLIAEKLCNLSGSQ